MTHETFERLYRDHSKALLGFLVYKTGDRALAEDLLVDTFERVLTARRGFTGAGPARRPGSTPSR